jgi:hypothetical protein
MLASKEECRKAIERVEEMMDLMKLSEIQRVHLDQVHKFLTLALKKLPSEASILRDQQRKKSSRKKKEPVSGS